MVLISGVVLTSEVVVTSALVGVLVLEVVSWFVLPDVIAVRSATVTLSPLAFVPITADVSTFTSPEVLPDADSPSNSERVTGLPSESVATTWSPLSSVTPKLLSVCLLPIIWSPMISLDAVIDCCSVRPAFCN